MILILVLLLAFGWSSRLFAQANFYQGKTITIVVGTKAGDAYLRSLLVMGARAILSGADYDRLWKRRFGGLQRASVVNRYFFARMGHPGYRWLMRALRRARDPRDWLRGYYAPSFWKSLWAPAAARLDGWTR